ncbi:hypothetical protein GYMLUDRAFT_53173 [Collybiopsis luxurians FD-317 M1]|nr:hypothetical protein GYMLUDRAFT_53173 [Collybiopsis luxurians FD-317 M1]
MSFLTWLKNLFDPEPSSQRQQQQQRQSYLPTYTDPMNPTRYNTYAKYDKDAKFDGDVAPPAYTAGPSASVSGPSAAYSRISFLGAPGFPSQSVTGPPPCFDNDNVSPVFFGSAHFSDGSVHPCKVVPALSPSPCRVPYGGSEFQHSGPYNLLPFDPQTMELVPASRGQIPKGRRPIEGGHERDRNVKLYHAVANVVDGGRFVRVPGKTAPHLSGCNVPWGGVEKVLRANYEILCWKEGVSPQDAKLVPPVEKS